MTTEGICTDDHLRAAVVKSVNWHEVMRALGLPTTSAYKIRVVRRQAQDLRLDTSHFRKRRWSDAQLRQAVIEGHAWNGPGRVLVRALRLPGLVATRTGRLRPDRRHTERPPADPGQDHHRHDEERLGGQRGQASYIIPSRVIAGRVRIMLRSYTKYIVGNAAGYLSRRAVAA